VGGLPLSSAIEFARAFELPGDLLSLVRALHKVRSRLDLRLGLQIALMRRDRGRCRPYGESHTGLRPRHRRRRGGSSIKSADGAACVLERVVPRPSVDAPRDSRKSTRSHRLDSCIDLLEFAVPHSSIASGSGDYLARASSCSSIAGAARGGRAMPCSRWYGATTPPGPALWVPGSAKAPSGSSI